MPISSSLLSRLRLVIVAFQKTNQPSDEGYRATACLQATLRLARPNEAPALRGLLSYDGTELRCDNSQRTNVCRLLAFRTGLHFERNALILFQRLEAFRADFRKVREQIFPARVRRDKSKSLSIVEPFDDTGFHIPLSLEIF